ncbi:MAG: class I SAM-dependent methyltransferase [Bacteriovoracaceae bacterium]|jgi:2-polyprenyl-3-methyl-5-hydroxy-6-metoxy-1,4-benzoquinol methylase|nr:class I SAM-dependent methyltransferase [Bacteriovoracaceae bacterium]
MDYYHNVRTDLIEPFKNQQGLKILEVGAASCSTLLYLKETKIAKHVTGVELLEVDPELQNHELIDRMIIGNFEDDQLDLENDFDVIICGDVLEHMIDPWKAVKNIYNHLKPNGHLIFSVPNIRFFKVLLKIGLKGSFKYEDSGIFDRTHLRFFCLEDAKELATQAGFKIEQCLSDLDVRPNNEKISLKDKKYLFHKFTFGLFKELLSYQNIIYSKKIKQIN